MSEPIKLPDEYPKLMEYREVYKLDKLIINVNNHAGFHEEDIKKMIMDFLNLNPKIGQKLYIYPDEKFPYYLIFDYFGNNGILTLMDNTKRSQEWLKDIYGFNL